MSLMSINQPFAFASPLLAQLQLRLSILPKNTVQQPSAVLVAITNEPQPQILYSLRAADMRHHAGEVAFAGGRREPEDDSNQAIALRETFEETGIRPDLVTILGELPLQHAKSGMAVLPIVGLIPPQVSMMPERGEIARLFWGDLATLIEQKTLPYTVNYGNVKITSPCFMVDGETVWGLTGRITASLLEIGFDRKIDWQFDIQTL